VTPMNGLARKVPASQLFGFATKWWIVKRPDMTSLQCCAGKNQVKVKLPVKVKLLETQHLHRRQLQHLHLNPVHRSNAHTCLSMFELPLTLLRHVHLAL
jgi:hypothetical protein